MSDNIDFSQPIAIDGRSLISVTGDEAESFLQNLITTDLDALATGEARAGALLTPQGKIMFDFLINRAQHGSFEFEIDSATAEDFCRRLTMYKLRAQVSIGKPEAIQIAVLFAPNPNDNKNCFIDTRFNSQPVLRIRSHTNAITDPSAFTLMRIKHGVAQSGVDFDLGEVFPHDINLDQTGGLSFIKGCYIGQEVVSRMHHRNSARRRTLHATANAPLPEAGAVIMANERAIGKLGSVVQTQALAICRIDRIAKAIVDGHSITADGIPLEFEVPQDAQFQINPDSTQNNEI